MLLFPSLRQNLDNWYHNMMCNVQKGLGNNGTQTAAVSNTGSATVSSDCNWASTQNGNATQ